jgi:hypothetical protein
MGDVLKQDMAISIGVMLKLQELFERDYQESSGEERRKIVEGATFALIAYCISLRGFEVPKIDLAALRENRVQIDPHRIGGVIARPCRCTFGWTL